MNENYTVKNAIFFVLNDGQYEKITINGVKDIQVEIGDFKSCDPDINMKSQSISFMGECDFNPSLRTLITIFGFFHGIKFWIEMKFKKG